MIESFAKYEGKNKIVIDIEKEYKNSWNLQDIFLVYSNVIETGKDDVLISFGKNGIQKFIEQLSNPDISEKNIA